MKNRIVISAVLAWSFLGLAGVQGQSLPLTTDSPEILPYPQGQDIPVTESIYYGTDTPLTATPTGMATPGSGPAEPSDWIMYRRPQSCYCPIGGQGPVQTELYMRIGPSFLVGNDSLYSETLTNGWSIQGGARVLFFEPEMEKAWFLDFGLGNTWNHGHNPDLKVPLSIIVPSPVGVPTRVNLGQGALPGVTVRDLNRTYINIGVGRLWYFEPANLPGSKGRIGIDVGGRYGNASGQFHEIRHRSDVIGGTYIGANLDLEVPCGSVAFQYGIRTEWAYTWSDILQTTSDVQDINLLFQLGLRY